MKTSFIYYFFDLIVKNMILATSQNALHFVMKCSKLRRFLGLRPRPRWGAYDAPSDPLVGGASCLRQSQLRAFGACSFPDYCL